MQISTPVRLLMAVLAGLLVWLYAPTLSRLVGQWWHDPNFSHGFFVPVFSGFVVWQERGRLRLIPQRPSWSGLLVLAFALGMLVIGQMGAELFLARFSLLLSLAGLIVLFWGWTLFRALLFPWAFLLLMIPIPAILFNQLTFPLQLLTSRVAAGVLSVLGVPILREGNVMYLSSGKPLEVAEACSGIHSLLSLFTLAIIYGYLLENRRWVRWLMVFAAIPIAIAANNLRIIGTGLLVQYWDPDKAEGYYHASWGLITFGISLVMLYALHAVICKLWPEPVKSRQTSAAGPEQISERESGRTTGKIEPISAQAPHLGARSGFAPRFVLAILLMASVATFLQAHTRGEVFPARLGLKTFPDRLGNWSGYDLPLDDEVLAVLGPGDFLLRLYQNEVDSQPEVGLFIAYFSSQRAGDTIHSPQNCLPGAGWSPVELSRITLDLPGYKPFPANRYIVAKGDARQLVVYWFWAHDRGVASEYWAKFYLVKDSIEMNRSDGALLRFTTPMFPGESAEAAQARILPLVRGVAPLLDDYIPR
jgi:exosortase D (VPLPA-CTERM-specific)